MANEAASIFFSKFSGIITELQAIADQADRGRLSVLMNQFADEFPDVYHTISELADMEPAAAVAGLIEQWPMFAILRIYSNHLRLVELIQTEIKLRREL